ncbi:MAG: TonB-dependent receptor domain-containing protein, partial [Candidatus Poribacteria bacterium]
EGPLVSDSNKAIDIKTDFSLRTFLSASTPIDTGANFEHFIGDSESEDFNETIIKLYIRDNRIKLYPFILGVGFELALDTRKSSISLKGRETSLYPNPYALLTSQIGSSLILQFGLERYILKQNLNDVYMEGDYTRFNPSLSPERAWHIHASLKYNLMKQLNAKLGVFDKEITGLMILKESKGLVGTDGSEIIAWIPDTIKNAHITGINAGWELLLMKNRLRQRLDYVHEIQSEDELILYRPKDKGVFAVEYSTPYEINLSLSTEFYGTRYVNKSGKKLASYMLWKPKVSKSFSNSAEASLAFEFYVGKENYQIWDGYKLPKTTIDLGATVRF